MSVNEKENLVIKQSQKDKRIEDEEGDIVCVTHDKSVDEAAAYLEEGFPACCPVDKHCMKKI
jgi:hypothetical protein